MSRVFGFLRPTLKRRVIFALIIAWGLVWIVLATCSSYEETNVNSNDKAIRGFAEGLLASIATIDDPGVARTTVASIHNLVETTQKLQPMPVTISMKLSDIRGRTIFVSHDGDEAALFSGTEELTSRTLHGTTYRVWRMTSPHWIISIAVSEHSLSYAVARNLNHSDLNRYLLIAFPFVLVPIWLAVARGLGPLQQLSKRIANKDPNDLTPLGINTRYAELVPLSSAIDHLINRLRTRIDREHSFVQDAAHELRTPLALISAEAHVMTMASQPHERLTAQQRLNQAIARASHLVQQLLALAHIESDRPASTGPVDVAALVRQEIALLAPVAIRRNIELSLEGPDVLQHDLHTHTLQSILQNLLSNAIAYIQSGGRVVVAISQTSACLRISVADDGPGIPESQRNLVFERFYRGADHDTPGSGLGLAIVSQGTARLGGKLTLHSGLDGKGCEFILEVPRQQV
jgi:two-component system, OmpR family, sensor histidine kinase QseC